MDLGLRDRVAVITGGSGRLGKAIARVLGREGAALALCARREGPLREAEKALRRDLPSATVSLFCVDVTDAEAVRSATAEIVRTFGRADILVNTAAAPGGLVRGTVDKTEASALLADFDTKTLGYLRFIQALTPEMRRHAWGRIVNIGGITGRSSNTLSGLRNIAVSHLSKTLADQFGRDGITVNSIHPGLVDDTAIPAAATGPGDAAEPEERRRRYGEACPIGRPVTGEEVGALVAFLTSGHGAAITGEAIGIDGGTARHIPV